MYSCKHLNPSKTGLPKTTYSASKNFSDADIILIIISKSSLRDFVGIEIGNGTWKKKKKKKSVYLS